MKLKVTLQSSTKTDVLYFDELTMLLTPGGLNIKARSPLFAEWIKTGQILLGGAENTEPLEAFKYLAASKSAMIQALGEEAKNFYVPTETWSWQKPYGWVHLQNFELFADEKPNLFWLFHKGLAEGFDITLKKQLSINDWEDYFTACCKAIQEIWLKELRSAVLSASFSEVLKDV
jgi:hypothetical protein